ncbi:hypothetical protein AGMMS49974_06460 [Deltaproteobacteria bacterium]|nr:hypothetical protein AGMMS49974_06460 [Deltaproteobacteria bacterium]GMO44989.1 MAG: hypothetical protein Ta2F_19220 [Termitinemataceae bacterium]
MKFILFLIFVLILFLAAPICSHAVVNICGQQNNSVKVYVDGKVIDAANIHATLKEVKRVLKGG